ncbi:hypothetical protein GJ496_003692 [Pomphorhynchus laevis]|nr:hypothetical protein GJ496_003692 [Pomphorhynchus laevis]
MRLQLAFGYLRAGDCDDCIRKECDSNSGSKVKHASKLSKHCLLSDKKHRHQNYHHSSNHDRHHYREQDQKKKGSEQSASSTRHNKHRPKLDSDDTTKQSTKSSQRFDKSDSNRNNNGKSSHYSQRCYRKSYYDEVTNSSTESSDSNDDNVNVVMKTSDRKCVNNSVGIVSSSGSRNLKTTETKQHNDVRRSKHNDHKVVTQQQQLDKSVTTDIISDNATSTDIAMSSSYNTKSQFSSNKSNHHKSHTSVKTSSSKNVGSHSNSSKSSSSAHTLLNRSSKVTLSKQHLIGSGISDDHDNEDSKLDIAEASEKIEQAMLKRRQRIEEWRQKRKPKSVKDPLDDVPKKDETIDTDKWILDEENEETSEEGKANKLDDDNSNCNNDKTGIDTAEDKELKKDDVEQTRSKENNLSSDEFKDNDNVVEEGNVGDEEIDPLDEYMLMISKQIKNLNEGEMTIRNSQGVSNIVASNNQSPQSPQQRSQKPTTTNDSKIDSCGGVTKAVIVRTNVSERKQINKGDIMEQNADALEYSSEDYSDDEDIFACKKKNVFTMRSLK